MRRPQSAYAFRSLCGTAVAAAKACATTHITAFIAVAAAVVALVAPHEARARPNYGGDVIGQCVTYNDVTYNVAAYTRPPWQVSDVTYVFDPPLDHLVFAPNPPSGTALYFLVPVGHYTVTARDFNFQFQGAYSITAPDCGPVRTGLTWRLISTNLPTGTIRVGCAGECDPYHGDTECTVALPLLCIKKVGAGFPLPLPASVNNTRLHNKWSGGVVGTTSATVPPTTLADADALCVQEFGEDWRVAEFHDGWGWSFQAYGGVSDPSSRFWVHIDDQPDGTCWH
jgi:hypothetical protein